MKNYTKRDAWFLLTILKRSLSLILGKIFCLSTFPLWQMRSRGIGWKGFCPGQMVEHTNPVDSRDNLKKREEISLNWYGGAKINGYPGSLEKILLHFLFLFFFTKEISDAIDQRVYKEAWVRIQRGWCRVLKPLKLVAQPPCGRSKGRKWLWTGVTFRSTWVDVGFDRLKMAPQIRPEWVVSGHLPKALRQQGQSENAHGQSWIGSEDFGRKS